MTPPNQFTAARPYVLIALLVTSIVGVAIYSASAYGALTIPSGNETAVVIEIEPLSNGKAVALGEDEVVVALITAPLPPDMLKNSERDTRIIFAGVIDRGIVLTKKEIGPIIEGWVNTYEERRNKNSPYIGLTVHVDIVNKATGKSIATSINSVTLNIDLLDKGYIGYYKLGINVDTSNTGKPARMGLEEVRYYEFSIAPDFSWLSVTDTKTELEETPQESSVASGLSDYTRCVPLGNWYAYECYNLTYYADTETFKNVLPSNYFKEVDGVTYMALPVLIAVNDYPAYSATIEVSISLGSTDFTTSVYPTYTIGPNIGKALNSPYSTTFPSVTLWKGDGAVWGGESYYFYETLSLYPSGDYSKGWIWVYARPYIEVYSVYRVYVDGSSEYLRDEVTAAISDVEVIGNIIQGGASYSLPPQDLIEVLFSGTEERYVDTLAPNESLPLGSVLGGFDTCGSDFEIGIPVGAMVGLVVLAAFPEATPAAAAIAGFQVSMSATGASIFVGGGIKNKGDDPYVPDDHDAYEQVYARVSKLKYKVDPPWWCFWCSTCYYDVPAGIYFRFY